ncbi:MAG TPA: hypothetical protein PKK06_04315 [Phycisphaerae bacterium]|nr:hypothetical protein [Phycisphaerae bacterium]HNU46186.1 hypothetical protein [Phycisphaerae bacterium]
MEPVREEPGLLWVFPGVEGGEHSVARACRAFRDAGVTADIEIHDWDRPFGLLVNLMSYERNRRDAAGVAERIAAYRAQHPAAPIDLVGYSGGGGVALMVTEALPDDVHVRHVLMVQPAVSPDYDLSTALAHIDGKLVLFYCPSDWLILGWGTRLFGTMDRRKVASAGKTGFDLPKAAPDPTQRAHLEQVCWTADMRATGHRGKHRNILGYRWNKAYVAPYLTPRADQSGNPADSSTMQSPPPVTSANHRASKCPPGSAGI